MAHIFQDISYISQAVFSSSPNLVFFAKRGVRHHNPVYISFQHQRGSHQDQLGVAGDWV
jgi:hypothetical protein